MNKDQPVKVLRLELEGVREQVASMLFDHYDGIGLKIKKQITEILTEEWVDAQIEKSVCSMVNKAIDQLADNYTLRTSIEKFITDAIVKKLKEKPEDEREN